MCESGLVCLARPPHTASILQQLLVKAQDIPIELPSLKGLEEALEKADQWKSEVQRMQVLKVCGGSKVVVWRSMVVWRFNSGGVEVQ